MYFGLVITLTKGKFSTVKAYAIMAVVYYKEYSIAYKRNYYKYKYENDYVHKQKQTMARTVSIETKSDSSVCHAQF